MTPLLWPVWCCAIWDSFSTTTIFERGCSCDNLIAVAKPMIPLPIIPMSYLGVPIGNLDGICFPSDEFDSTTHRNWRS